MRIGAITELGAWLIDGNPSHALAARRLQRTADTDISRVAATARAILAAPTASDSQIPLSRWTEETGGETERPNTLGGRIHSRDVHTDKSPPSHSSNELAIVTIHARPDYRSERCERMQELSRLTSIACLSYL